MKYFTVWVAILKTLLRKTLFANICNCRKRYYANIVHKHVSLYYCKQRFKLQNVEIFLPQFCQNNHSKVDAILGFGKAVITPIKQLTYAMRHSRIKLIIKINTLCQIIKNWTSLGQLLCVANWFHHLVYVCVLPLNCVYLCFFTKINTIPWVFFKFFELVRNRATHHTCGSTLNQLDIRSERVLHRVWKSGLKINKDKLQIRK